MNPDDRIDTALRAIARADASRGFAAQVRSRIEAGDRAPVVWWPRLARGFGGGGAGRLLRVGAARRARAITTDGDEGGDRYAVADRRHRACPGADCAPARDGSACEDGAARRTAITTRRCGVASTGGISLSSVAPDAMVVVDHVIAPLAPIAPLSVREMLGDANQGEL